MIKEKVIAIDGPAGSGKSTLAKSLAKSLGFIYVDTGAMFRALGLCAQKRNIPIENDLALGKFLEQLNFNYEKNQILIDGEDFSKEIRDHFVSHLASEISKKPMVREFLLKIQRDLSKDQIIVMEGRDIGTVVFPGAFCKIFLTALPEIRAQRRFKDLEEQIPFQKVLRDVKERDERDRKREIAPLKPAPDAILLDTGNLNLEESLSALKKVVEEKLRVLGLK
jgi:cytidylate kinase